MKKKIKSEKGAIAALVVVTVLMFALILMGTYMAITNLRKSQLESDIRIQQLYGGDVENIEQVYTSIVEEKDDGPIFTAVANAPDIRGFNEENTYYVTWNLESSPYEINDSIPVNENPPSNWYDYTAGVNHWANIKTTGGGNNCYWVWIPRYAYQVPDRDSGGETVQIKFLEGTSNVPIGETEEITNTTPTEGSWVVHPAFTNSGNGGFGELEGIWVAKFEASSSQVSEATVNTDLTTTGGGNTTSLQVRVIPNVTSWRGITVGNIFTVCRNLTTDGNSVEGATSVDSHMMKNTEWGACAYLSRSVYGKNGAVWNNPYYNNRTNYSPITGLCGTSQDASQTTLDNTYKYNTEGGINASTTGNVYGIYDMAGGTWEYVTSVISGKLSNGTYYNFSNIDPRYYEEYDSYNNTKYGDAMYETSTSASSDASSAKSWDIDLSHFVTSSSPVLYRGGQSYDASGAGIFAFSHNTGTAVVHGGFRPCIINF